MPHKGSHVQHSRVVPLTKELARSFFCSTPVAAQELESTSHYSLNLCLAHSGVSRLLSHSATSTRLLLSLSLKSGALGLLLLARLSNHISGLLATRRHFSSGLQLGTCHAQVAVQTTTMLAQLPYTTKPTTLACPSLWNVQQICQAISSIVSLQHNQYHAFCTRVFQA